MVLAARPGLSASSCCARRCTASSASRSASGAAAIAGTVNNSLGLGSDRCLATLFRENLPPRRPDRQPWRPEPHAIWAGSCPEPSGLHGRNPRVDKPANPQAHCYHNNLFLAPGHMLLPD